MSRMMFAAAAFGVAIMVVTTSALAHRSGCHRWHSCPSDRGTYVCGDLGYSRYCLKGAKKPQSTKLVADQPIASKSIVIVDGDTLKVGGIRIRLFGIDAPEKRQTCWAGDKEYSCGRRAAEALASIIKRQPVNCTQRDKDRGGRIVAICRVGAIDLGREMVRRGWAAAYRQYSNKYVADEDAARASKVGVWRGHFTMPWTWRQMQR